MRKISISLLIYFMGSSIGFGQLKDALSLTLSNGTNSDETIIRFHEAASDSFDSNWDAYKFSNYGNTPNFYTTADGIDYSINALKAPFVDKTVQLKVQVALSGNYSITANELGSFDSLCTIQLVDQKLSTVIDLRATTSYLFDFQVGDPADRFVVNFKNNIPNPGNSFSTPSPVFVAYELRNENIKAYSFEGKIRVDIQDYSGNVEISLFDPSGNEIIQPFNEDVSSSNNSFIFNPTCNGICFLKVTNGEDYFALKVFKVD